VFIFKNLANVALSKGDHNSSLDCFRKALDIRLQIVASNDPTIAAIHHVIGNIYLDKGDYKQAINSFNTALTINRRTFAEDAVKIAASLK
jgi:tetratricopeptide (TPR) repeat protein